MFENHLRFTEKVRVCQKRSPGDAGGPSPNTPSVIKYLNTQVFNYRLIKLLNNFTFQF